MAYEVIILGHLHMPLYFLETFTEYPYSKDYANDSLSKRHKSVKRSQICKLENGRCSPALSTKIFTQFIYGGIIWSGFYLHWLFV